MQHAENKRFGFCVCRYVRRAAKLVIVIFINDKLKNTTLIHTI